MVQQQQLLLVNGDLSGLNDRDGVCDKIPNKQKQEEREEEEEERRKEGRQTRMQYSFCWARVVAHYSSAAYIGKQLGSLVEIWSGSRLHMVELELQQEENFV